MSKQPTDIESYFSDKPNLDKIFINLSKIIRSDKLTPDQIETFRNDVGLISRFNKEALNETNYIHDSDGRTLLHHACSQNHQELVRLLIENGAKVNAADRGMYTPLHLASTSKEITKFLIEAGADINAKDSQEYNSLHLLCRSDRLSKTEKIEIAKILIEHDADINAKNTFGRTPLYYLGDSELEGKLTKIYEDHLAARKSQEETTQLTESQSEKDKFGQQASEPKRTKQRRNISAQPNPEDKLQANSPLKHEIEENIAANGRDESGQQTLELEQIEQKGNSLSHLNSNNNLGNNLAPKYERGKNIIEWAKESISTLFNKFIYMLRSLKTKFVTRSENISKSVKNISGFFSSNRANNMFNNQRQYKGEKTR